MKINNTNILSLSFKALALSLISCASVNAATVAINLDVPDTRGDGDAGIPTISDFLTQNPNGGLNASTQFINSGGNGFANGAGFTELDGLLTTDGFTFATTGTSNGFNAGDTAHNDLNPITEGYSFNLTGNTITVSGLAALTNAGDQVIFSFSGIGDNNGQQSQFTMAYAGLIANEGNTQSSFYNIPGEPRISSVGSVSFVNFTYAADGTTDTATVTIDSGGYLNALSVSVIAVPEPSSTALLGLGGLTLIMRRNRQQ